jgi:hypothetical protein
VLYLAISPKDQIPQDSWLQLAHAMNRRAWFPFYGKAMSFNPSKMKAAHAHKRLNASP